MESIRLKLIKLSSYKKRLIQDRDRIKHALLITRNQFKLIEIDLEKKRVIKNNFQSKACADSKEFNSQKRLMYMEYIEIINRDILCIQVIASQVSVLVEKESEKLLKALKTLKLTENKESILNDELREVQQSKRDNLSSDSYLYKTQGFVI